MARRGAIIVSAIAILVFVILILISDLSVLPGYFRNHQNDMLVLTLLYIILYSLRLLRNYALFRTNDFTDLKLYEFIPAALMAGTIATFGPLKSGELVAMEIYQQHHGIKRANSLSVIVVSRVFDILSVLLLITTILFNLPSSLDDLIFLVSLILLVLIVVLPILLSEQVGLRVLDLVKSLVREKMTSILEKFESLALEYYQNLEMIFSLKNGILLVFFTGARWILEVYFMRILLVSFDVDLTLIQLAPVVGLAYAIGVSSGTPGAIGTFQLTALSVLFAYGVDIDLAAVALLVGAALSIVVNIGLGTLGAVISNFMVFFTRQQKMED